MRFEVRCEVGGGDEEEEVDGDEEEVWGDEVSGRK